MVRYSYALSFYAEMENIAEYLSDSFQVKPGEEKLRIPSTSKYDLILKTFYEGWKQLKKCDKCFSTLSESFNSMKVKLPELDSYILQGVLLVLEVNANFFYLCKLKWEGGQWETMAKVAKLNAGKLKTAESYFN